MKTMYLIRDVFKTKPGKAKELVKIFKKAQPHFEKTEGVRNAKILTDVVSDYWTVVLESEVEDIGMFMTSLRSATASPELIEIMKGYMDLIDSGYREVYMIE